MLSKEEYKKRKINEYYRNKKKNEKIINKYSEKRENHIDRIIDNLARRACCYFKKHNIDRNLSHLELIGCLKEKLEEHLKEQFVDNMSYENYGYWEVDHIKPVSLCNNSIENLKEIFNYKNLKPLWKTDNRTKGAKYNDCEL